MSRRVMRGFDHHEFKRLRLSWRGTGISVQDLSRLSNVSASTLGTWDNGTRTPNIDKLAPVLAVLEAPVSAVVRIPPGERFLSDLRNLASHTQPQLAKAAGMSTQNLSKLERGEIPMTDARAQALAPLLGVSEAEAWAAWQRAKDRPPGTPA
ncbi:MAG: helix-turn-helix domain-containing protein [Segniliparus sp.]|uniref:helix-turn-helix domain-containing protein n=1 Tax=Segniliparus sp. TaxID=2804064 RepID=UPI003F3B5330